MQEHMRMRAHTHTALVPNSGTGDKLFRNVELSVGQNYLGKPPRKIGLGSYGKAEFR